MCLEYHAVVLRRAGGLAGCGAGGRGWAGLACPSPSAGRKAPPDRNGGTPSAPAGENRGGGKRRTGPAPFLRRCMPFAIPVCRVLLVLLGGLCGAFALGVRNSQIVDATWADGRRVGIFPGGSLPAGTAGRCGDRHGPLGGAPWLGRGHPCGGDGVPPKRNRGRCPAGGGPRHQPNPVCGRQFWGPNGSAAGLVCGTVSFAGHRRGGPGPAGPGRVFLGAERLGPAGGVCGGLAGLPALSERAGRGDLLLCDDAGRRDRERLCAGPGGSLPAVRPGVFPPRPCPIGWRWAAATRSSGRPPAMARASRPCVWLPGWRLRRCGMQSRGGAPGPQPRGPLPVRSGRRSRSAHPRSCVPAPAARRSAAPARPAGRSRSARLRG